MWPFWDIATAPVLRAINARRVVEIGALRGENTVLMLEHLGPDAELHVIDPVPDFDPGEHEKQFAGRYVFHRDISHNVLPTLGPVDAALIDGDHNWYTVYHELRMLSEAARSAGAPLPVMIMHDVEWPYGRRDLYYTPELIPAEFRHEYDQRGMGRQRAELLPKGRGGLNPEMYNAVMEGGPRNGVMTALDDFVAEYDKPLRRVVLPVFWGLAIVAEEERLEREPELARLLDHLEASLEAKDALLDMSERMRIKAMMFQHAAVSDATERIDSLVTRYLDTIRAAVLDEHYIENEVRIAYLVEGLERGRGFEEQKLRDPRRFMKEDIRIALAERRSGQLPGTTSDRNVYFPYTAMGRVRLDHLQRCLDTVRRDAVEGDLVECGTGRGGGAIFMRAYLAAHDLRHRRVWVADEFRSSPTTNGDAPVGPEAKPTVPFGGRGFPEILADINVVRDGFDRFDLFDNRVRFLQGPFAETLPGAPIRQVSLLRIGASAAAEAEAILDIMYDRLAPGGFVVIEHHKACADGVQAFRERTTIAEPFERVDDATIVWRKSEGDGPVTSPRAARRRGRLGAPLAPKAPTDRCDLSLVVVFYDMKREAERTLHSLSRAYQREIEDLDYEVLVLDNGSSDDQTLGEEFVHSFGNEFRYVRIERDKASPSPVSALNQGIRIARGEVIALMIDGAHVVTPGMLHYGMKGIATYEPALVLAQQWYVGPGQQPDMMLNGYDQDYEDRLFAEIDWPTDGYRLFDIGHFIGDRDWFDGLWESNCFFVPRKLLEQVGGFDESFAMPGGGASNLELYERLASSPDINVVTMLGEGSFHQLHGGDTTNQAEPEERRRRVTSYLSHYQELRGKQFRGHGKPIHYVGSMQAGAFRTKARRRTAKAFLSAARQGAGLPEVPAPIPEDFAFDFIDAFWRNLAWRETTWLGRPLPKAPTDLIAYQEMVTRAKPDWIIDLPTGDGVRAFFFATICELLGHGQVLSIDPDDGTDRPVHPRITYLRGPTTNKQTLEDARSVVGDDANGLVILGSSGSRQQTMAEFKAYSPFVGIGSYAVVENTIVNGHPVWPEFGPGPWEAVKQLLNRRTEFMPDPTLERFALTFNPGGFLKRTR